MLTTREVAERIGVKYPTVMLWIKKERLPGAVKENSPRGAYWLIPESALVGIVKRKQGRPRKAKDATVTESKPRKKAAKKGAAAK